MTNQHPITPPLELLQQWMTEFYGTPIVPGEACTDLATRAAQWGADQELEACCNWVAVESITAATELRAWRRAKPPTLKGQALEVFEALIHGDASGLDVGVIRRALEALPE